MSIIQLRNVRLAFPVLWEPKTVQGEGEPAYSSAFLLPPDHPQIKEIQDATERVGKEKWKDQWPAVKKALTASDKLALHDGDTKAQYAGYEGNLFINARSPANKRPLVIDRDKTVLIAADGRPYAGCFVNASLEIWAQSNGYGKRINASLRAVQFVKDGDSFGGGTPANADEFDDLSNGADNLEDVA
ncbi:DUF2815 family protein [Dongia sp.]|uniref:DUF2815 family protein n=1 Tax=Dongia sp. TaxID=1977262 RepID=UPI0035B340B0